MPQAILDLENQSIGADGAPTLGPALALAIDEWRLGNRSRELRLHLLFLLWYCNVEPPHLTGLDERVVNSAALPQLFSAVYETFADAIMDDPETLFVVGLMATLSPWLLGGDTAEWKARSEEFRNRYRHLRPDGLPPSHFENRGVYGEYFSAQVAVPGGF